jgi:hypothetical protein
MATQITYSQAARFPAPAPPRARVEDGLVTLENWRRGSAAAVVLGTASLLFATTLRPSLQVAIAIALFAAAVFAIASHVVRKTRLTSLAIYTEFAHLPGVAREHRRLSSPRRHRALARELRAAVASTRTPSRVSGCQVPVLRDRITGVRSELLDIATALDQGRLIDAVCVALLHALLRDGGSPLYNPNVPVAHLRETVSRVTLAVARPS